MRKTERDNIAIRDLIDLAVEHKIWINKDALVYLVRSGLFDVIKEKVLEETSKVTDNISDHLINREEFWEEVKKGLKEPTTKAIPLELPQYLDDGGTIKEIKKVGENKWLVK